MKKFFGMWDSLINAIQPAGDWVAILPIRLLMAYEFGKSGFTKYGASGVPGWFENLQDKFLFPFSVIPPEVSWFLATWTEIIGGICLFFGLFTRFWAFSMIILSIVAISGVHWPDRHLRGYCLFPPSPITSKVSIRTVTCSRTFRSNQY